MFHFRIEKTKAKRSVCKRVGVLKNTFTKDNLLHFAVWILQN